jgi:hypothetical protein
VTGIRGPGSRSPRRALQYLQRAGFAPAENDGARFAKAASPRTIRRAALAGTTVASSSETGLSPVGPRRDGRPMKGEMIFYAVLLAIMILSIVLPRPRHRRAHRR